VGVGGRGRGLISVQVGGRGGNGGSGKEGGAGMWDEGGGDGGELGVGGEWLSGWAGCVCGVHGGRDGSVERWRVGVSEE